MKKWKLLAITLLIIAIGIFGVSKVLGDAGGSITNPYIGFWDNSGTINLDTGAGWWATTDPNYAEIPNLPPGDYLVEISNSFVWSCAEDKLIRFTFLIVDWPTVEPNGEYIGGGVTESTGYFKAPVTGRRTLSSLTKFQWYLHLEGQAFKVWMFAESQNGTAVKIFQRAISVKAYPVDVSLCQFISGQWYCPN